MWTFRQSTGELFDPHGEVAGRGYAGGNIPPHHEQAAVNNPARQAERMVGPLPRGFYAIGPAHTEPTLGPCAMYLQPRHDNQMFGRSGFFIHADSIAHPGQASEGCIVLPATVRLGLSQSKDRDLQVVE